jgi:uncharacterized SAM-binding protein YcdF (DUF218 family)
MRELRIAGDNFKLARHTTHIDRVYLVSIPEWGIGTHVLRFGPMRRYDKRQEIIAYVAPCVSLFATKFALVFGTRHGVPKFVEEILSLYRQRYFTDLIISGGLTGHGTDPEATVLHQALLSSGIPERVMTVEDKAMNTGQNVTFSREKVRDLGITELLLIGKICSKRRYIMTVRKQWPEVRSICCHGVNYFSHPADQWWKDREFRRRVISEYRKIPLYIDHGFISDVSIVDGVVL